MSEEPVGRGKPSYDEADRRLREAYVSLAETGERMSVSAICRRSQLNRSTFYAHFQDVEQLGFKMFTDLILGMEHVMSQTLGEGFLSDPGPAVRAMGAYVAENRNLYRMLFASSFSSDFANVLRETMRTASGSSGLERQVHFDYVAGGLLSIYRAWVLGLYGEVGVDEINEQTVRLLRHESR